MGVVLKSTPQTPGSAALALSKDVASLERLVNASISALRHAAAAQQQQQHQTQTHGGSGLPVPPSAAQQRRR